MNEKVKELIFKFQHLGIETAETGATLIGKAPHIALLAWLNKIYPTLDTDDIILLETKLKTTIPTEFKKFLMGFSNGLHILNTTFCIDGLRRNYVRTANKVWQPFDLDIPNIYERPQNAKESFFFIGGYDWDGSLLYIDKDTNVVHYCDRDNAASLFQWKSFEEMLISEITRLYTLYDENGVQLDENMPTVPV